MLVELAGLPGVGKSTVARALARRLDAVWLRVDTLEAAMLAAGLRRSHATGLAAYLAVRDQAREQLALGRSVVVDAVNGVEPARRLWRELARERRVRLRVVELVCADAREHRRRVERRAAPTPPLPKPSWEEVLRREYAPWRGRLLTLDTTRPVRENVRRAVAQLRRGRGPRR